MSAVVPISIRTLAVALAAATLLCRVASADRATPAWVDEARAAAARLGGGLIPELRAALAGGGPETAVRVCNLRAPEIAAQVSGPGLQVGRTALRVRNPDNAPDAWERQVLFDLRDRLAAGEAATRIEHWEVQRRNGRRIGRWMKAIVTQPVCTTCHGKRIDPGLAGTIERLYPEDQATGFRIGDLRGAFTVEVELPAKR